MLEKSFGLLFYLRKQRNEETGLMYIILRVTVDGQQKEMSVKRKWAYSSWNAHANRFTGTREDAKQLNDYLDSVQSKVYDARQ
ncbi:hypothetical protein INP83_16855 [Mucilaginibacter sp. 21P]|uniref:Arm DNA-binding domain-containing protein n=1 Tax=Mucilaginibacter sp. 21P TaxID=2778902 RepID=UPI001C57DD65|nr:Arm DNA-binding domain-containing protein [Mucilaginibacter sp. 21P]QXV64739.1 hypothetical protein INP83_16855 [Mucilaginibacter sp. 21P]